MPKRIVLMIFFFAVLAFAADAQNPAPKIAAWQTQVHYLSGTGKDNTVMWDFFCTSGRGQGTWT